MSKGEVKMTMNSPAEEPGPGGQGRASPAPPPDGGWGWLVVFAAFMIHIVIDGITYSFGVFYVELLDYFGEGKGYTAWIVSVLVGVTLCSGPIASSLVNRFGCRAVTVSGALLAAACVLVSALAANVLTLIFSVGLGAGLGFGLVYLPAIVSVTLWFERYRSLATGIAVCGSGLGTFLFAPVTRKLIDEFGWRGAMFIMGAIVLNCVPFGIMLWPIPEVLSRPALEPCVPKDTRESQQSSGYPDNENIINGDIGRKNEALPFKTNGCHKPNEDIPFLKIVQHDSMANITDYESQTPSKRRVKRDCRWLTQVVDVSLLVDPIFMLFSVSNFLTSIGFYTPYVYIVAQANTLGIEDSSYFLSIIGIANTVGRLVIGYISDKPRVNRLFVYNICLIVCGISTGLAMLCWEFWGLALYGCVFGFTIGACVGLTSVVLVDLLGLARLTNAFGLLMLFPGLASLLGPPLAGWLFDRLGSYRPGFYVAGVTIAFSGIILFVIPLMQRRKGISS